MWQLPIKRKYWMSCDKFTIQIGVDGLNYIQFAPPIVRKFKGQPLDNLIRWMTKLGGFQQEEL